MLPKINKCFPDLGDTLGGVLVSIYGVGFTGTIEVKIGSAAVPVFSVISDSEIQIVTPAKTAGQYDVTVRTSEGADTATRGFESWDPMHIPGAVLWDAEATSTVSTVGGKVSLWKDRGGTGKNWAQSTADRRPLYLADALINSQRSVHCVRFNGVPPNFNFLTQTKVALASGNSVFWVGRTKNSTKVAPSGTSSLPMPIVGDDQGSTSGVLAGMLGGQIAINNYSSAVGGYQLFYIGNQDSADWKPHVWGVTHDKPTGNIAAYQDGIVQPYTPGGFALSSAYSAALGYSVLGSAYQHADFFDGDLFAVIVMNSVAANDDIAKISLWAYGRYMRGLYAWKQNLQGGTTAHVAATEAPWIGRDGPWLEWFGQQVVLMGGWNSGPPAQFANKFTTNEIWRSLTRGASWQKVLPNDDSLTSGTTRWRRRHTFAHCVHSCNGVDYLCIVNGDMFDDVSGYNGGLGIYDHVPRDVWRSKDILNWDLMTNATPWSQRTLGMAASYNGLLYFMGGQTDFSQQATALSEVWASVDCGATWKQLPNAPWAARSQAGLVVFNGYLYLVGGFRYDNRSSSQVYYNDVWRFDGKIWKGVLANAPWQGKGYISCVVFDNRLWVLSGGRQGQNTNEVWFSDGGDRWVRQPDVPWHPSHADGVCVTDTPGILHAAGNYSVTSEERDVWEMVVL